MLRGKISQTSTLLLLLLRTNNFKFLISYRL